MYRDDEVSFDAMLEACARIQRERKDEVNCPEVAVAVLAEHAIHKIQRWGGGVPDEAWVRPRGETQRSITTWQHETFGEANSAASCAERAAAEMHELVDAIYDEPHKATEECADVLICLYRVAEMLGVDLHREVDRKMAINRQRKWVVDGNGHGRHVKEGGPAEGK